MKFSSKLCTHCAFSKLEYISHLFLVFLLLLWTGKCLLVLVLLTFFEGSCRKKRYFDIWVLAFLWSKTKTLDFTSNFRSLFSYTVILIFFLNTMISFFPTTVLTHKKKFILHLRNTAFCTVLLEKKKMWKKTLLFSSPLSAMSRLWKAQTPSIQKFSHLPTLSRHSIKTAIIKAWKLDYLQNYTINDPGNCHSSNLRKLWQIL